MAGHLACYSHLFLSDDYFRRMNFNAHLCRLWNGFTVFLLAESHEVDPWSIKDCICAVKKSFLTRKLTKCFNLDNWNTLVDIFLHRAFI